MRNPVVHGSWLEVVEVLKVRSLRVTEDEGHECVAVIDGIQIFSLHELLNVVFNDGSLVDSSCLSPSCIDANAVSEGENVLKSLVLKGVGVNVNNTLVISNA